MLLYITLLVNMEKFNNDPSYLGSTAIDIERHRSFIQKTADS